MNKIKFFRNQFRHLQNNPEVGRGTDLEHCIVYNTDGDILIKNYTNTPKALKAKVVYHEAPTLCIPVNPHLSRAQREVSPVADSVSEKERCTVCTPRKVLDNRRFSSVTQHLPGKCEILRGKRTTSQKVLSPHC